MFTAAKMDLRRSKSIPDQTTMRDRRFLSAVTSMDSTPFDTLGTVIRDGALSSFALSKLKTIKADAVVPLTVQAMETIHFDDDDRWRAVLGASTVTANILLWLYEQRRSAYHALVANNECVEGARSACVDSDWRVQVVVSGKTRTVNVLPPNAEAVTMEAWAAAVASLADVEAWFAEKNPRNVTSTTAAPTFLGSVVSMEFDNGQSYDVLLPKASLVSSRWLYTILVFKPDGIEKWERFFLDPKDEGTKWKVVFRLPDRTVDEEPSPFVRTPTTVRLESLCWVYQTSDYFQSFMPKSVLADLSRAASALNVGLALPPTLEVSLTGAAGLSLYNAVRLLLHGLRGERAALFLHPGKSVYVVWTENRGSFDMRVVERDVVRRLRDVDAATMLRHSCGYLRNALTQDGSLLAEPFDAAALESREFGEYWDTIVASYNTEEELVRCRCGYPFKAASAACVMCGAGALAPSPHASQQDEPDEPQHKQAGKVHTKCGRVVPMFNAESEPNLTCPYCGVTEAGALWMTEAEHKRRHAMHQFSPAATSGGWFCLQCFDNEARHVFVPSMGRTCRRCGAFAV